MPIIKIIALSTMFVRSFKYEIKAMIKNPIPIKKIKNFLFIGSFMKCLSNIFIL
jgi:hypothetical protein